MSHDAPRLEAIPSRDVLAPRKQREMIAVSFGQWDRLKKRVKSLGNPRIDHTDYVLAAWSASITLVISFLGYLSQADRPGWALPTYGVGALAGAVVALVIGRFQRDEEKLRTEDADDIVEEMTSIEEAYLRSTAG